MSGRSKEKTITLPLSVAQSIRWYLQGMRGLIAFAPMLASPRQRRDLQRLIKGIEARIVRAGGKLNADT
jgi:hypothetical protein